MIPPAAPEKSDARLWLAAMLLSVPLNLAIVALILYSADRMRRIRPASAPPESTTRSVLIVPAAPLPEPEPEPEPSGPRRFARSTPDQASEAPEDPAFMGEHDTRATSDAPPVAGAPEMPSQKGEKPEFGEIETTESDYRDGELEPANQGDPGEAVAAAPEAAESPSEAPEPAEAAEEGGSEEMVQREDDPSTPSQVLAETPFPVERPVLPVEEDKEEQSAPGESAQETAETAEPVAPPTPAEPVVPSPAGERAFTGNQRKTELKGSITRGGKAALDIESGPLGKYHAAISRAIERSWQRKVIQNLDYIKPGVIRVRVVLDPGGRVRSVGTVDEFGIGAIQKGFTHSAIREAELPTMPAEVKRQLDGEPLELLYNFIF